FERIVLVKKNAASLLKKHFEKKNYQAEMIMLSGNTDCYQPAERKFRITRQILELCLLHKHPIGIITKNSLLLRDLDLIKELHHQQLIKITLSITTLNEDLRRVLEPRTASIKKRLHTLKTLSELGMQVNVNLAPIIPGLNNHEVFDLVKTIAEHGAASANYIMVRLNGQIGEIFEAWVKQTYPHRESKILNQIKETHGGKLNDSRWKTRMRGQGKYAEQVKDMFNLAKKMHLPEIEKTVLNCSSFVANPRTPTLF
ncbi:MAG: radical SAM protein, partial [Flavobacteriales bacterium]